MRQLQTEILVIGGGATGTGVAYDLARRGFKTILVEKRDLTHGTTGRYHGLLHSGGRYVIKDPNAAVECIEENVILRRIMPHCIEDSGGYFVQTPDDDPDYGDSFAVACAAAGIPCQEIALAEMFKQEPALNPAISRCFAVPDAAADSFLATHAVAEAAQAFGGQILTYHQVEGLIRQGDRVAGAICRDLIKDDQVAINADVVVNASGAWAGRLAKSVGLEVTVRAGKGIMIAANHRLVNTVINRLKMPADGDIIVPIHTVTVIGTTDEEAADPDKLEIEPWEVQLMLDEGEKLIPGFRHMRMLRAWAGARPLYQEKSDADTRDLTRAYALLDHETRDGVAGIVTITGGKWTTFRQMAEATADRVCQKLGVVRPCQTHLEPLPNPFDPSQNRRYHTLGGRLKQVESNQSYGQLVCECELAIRQDVENAVLRSGAKNIDDIRRDVRLGMGPCQGGFCSMRAAGIWEQLRPSTTESPNKLLPSFLQERWKGLTPILWGRQLQQERFNELIYRNLLNAEQLGEPEEF